LHKIPTQTIFTGKQIVSLTTCHSTNDIAADKLNRQEAHDGLVVVTDQQTRGRGQRGNVWHAEPGQNLTFSLVYMPRFLKPDEQFLLNIIASLGIKDVLQQFLLQGIAIKWPNDVYVQGKKVAGILIECAIKGQELQHAIVGIGLNANQTEFDVPNATSVQLLTHHKADLPDLLGNLLGHIEKYYLMVKRGQVGQLWQWYYQHLMWYQEPHTYIIKGQQVKGQISRVDAWGRLGIVVAGKERFFGVKEVVFVN